MMTTKDTHKHPPQVSTRKLIRVHALMMTNSVSPLRLNGGVQPGFLQRLAPEGSRAEVILPLSPGSSNPHSF
jgi:hypothetical protein